MNDQNFKEMLKKSYVDTPIASPYEFSKIWTKVEENRASFKDKVVFSLSFAVLILSVVFMHPTITFEKEINSVSSNFYYYKGSELTSFKYIN